MQIRTPFFLSSSPWRRCVVISFLATIMASQTPYGQPQAKAAEQSLLSRRIAMGVGKSTVIDLPSEASEVVVANPKIADAIVRTARQLYIVGVDAGQTTISAVGADGRQIASLEISIGRDVGELSQLLRVALPKSNIVPRTVNGTIILTGTVASPVEARRAMDIAKGFTGGQTQGDGSKGGPGASGGGDNGQGSSVVNALTIQGEDQVMVKVTVAEVSRKVLKQLGVSAQGTASDTLLRGGWGSLVQSNPYGINPAKSDSALTVLGPNNTQATLKAFERYGVARVLAEPSVTAVSGETAKLVVGGEIPVPSQTGNCMMFGTTSSLTPGSRNASCIPGITFKQYGVILNFLPTVMSEGRILLHIGTEVTEVDRQNSYTYADVTVPAFRTRKHETSVELPSGGSIASAGLLLEKSEQAITGLPGLTDIPILGALFRSRDYMRDETELLIMVTPFIVRPINAQEVSRPTDGFADASDPQAWLLGRVNRIYASRSNPQIQQQFKGRIGFIND
jgi:pilus assembly protein CpaC